MSASIIRSLAQATNPPFAATHTPSLTFATMPKQDAIVILTCMDPRCNPHAFWNLAGEDGPAVMRNAGGRASDALRSLRVLSTVMGMGTRTLGAVAVVHHTDCGLLNFGDGFVRGRLAERVRGEGREEVLGQVESLEVGGFTDIDASVREDMAIIKADPFLPKDLEVVGYVYDVFSGETREVV